MPDSTHKDADRSKHSSLSLRFIDEYLRSGTSGRLTGLLLGQLDAFNRIGSTFGAESSEEFCAEYAQSLRMLLPPNTPVIRLSGRRFAVLLGLDSMTTIIDIASRLAEDEPPQFRIGDDTLFVDLTLGVAVYPTHADDASSLFRRAELALNEARAHELNFEIYRPDATQQQTALWKFASELEQAVQKRAIEVYMQPKVRVADGMMVGAEALIRWRQSTGRLVLPGDFIPLAERSGSVVPITWLMFDKIAAIVESWPPFDVPFSIAVNISAQVLDNTDFSVKLNELRQSLAENGVDLIVELTEESLVENHKAALSKLNRIRKNGIGLAIDDFGKGYSSLTYLKDIPATEIKIDKTFVGTVATDKKDWHIIKATIELAHAFGMRVVAEGVDTVESLHALEELGCELAQGFLIARPMRGELLVEWAKAHTAASSARLLFPSERALLAGA
jgi:EAL domain-containing protein (putative c-di-GMP-specific phosphodiesterase class I)